MTDGYDLGFARPADVTAAAGLVRRYDLEVGGYSDFSEEDLVEITRIAGFEFGRDAWVARWGDDVVAFGMVWTRGEALYSVGIVDRDHVGRGLGAWLLERGEERAEATGAAALRGWVDAKDERAAQLFAARGYSPVRRHYSMLCRRLEPRVVQPPAGIAIRTASPDETTVLHRVLQEGFAEHWGWAPTPYDEWLERTAGRSDTQPDLWFLAWEGDEPVGALMGALREGVGWVASLAVLEPWRGRGVGRALLEHALADFVARDAHEVGLDVDAGNETGAIALYEKVGFEPVKTNVIFEKPMAAGRPNENPSPPA